MNKKFFLIILFFMIVPACIPIQIEPPPPSPQSIQVRIAQSLLPILNDNLLRCGENHPGILINLEIQNNSILEDDSGIRILLGEPLEGIGVYLYQLGSEEIVVITNIESEINSGNLESIREMFTAESSNRVVLTYPKGDNLRTLFQDVVLGAEEFSPDSLVVSEPGEMLQSVVQNRDSIGYIPESWVTRDVKVIPLDPHYQEALRHPILGLTIQEPDRLEKDFLACLQNSRGRDSE